MANSTRFLIELPVVGASADTWGNILNAYFNSLEPLIFDKRGDTVNGNLSVTGSTGLTTLSAATQDAVRVVGRAGGTGSFINSLTTGTLTANVTNTLPIVTGTLATLANTTQTFAGATTFNTTFALAATTQNIALGTSQTTGTFTVGGTAQTTDITIGRSTAAQTLQLATGVTANATTKTVNLGTGGGVGSTSNINIGSSVAGTTTINSPSTAVSALTATSVTTPTINASTSLALQTGGTTQATLTQAGNLLVGTTTDIGRFAVSNGVFRNETTFDAVGVVNQALNEARSATAVQSLYGSEVRLFSGAGGAQAERARITAAGYCKASSTGVYGFLANQSHEFNNNSGGAVVISNDTLSNSAGDGFNASRVSASGNHYSGITNGTTVYRVLANGNVQNTNNSYGAISDIKLKENITDATPKLASLNQLRVVNYNLKADESKLKQIGLIAQEVEQIFPGLVESTPDTVEVTKTRTVEVPAVLDEEGNEVTPATTTEETYTEREPNGEVTKAVKYSVLVPMLLKAVQELSAQNAALESRLAALEAK